jgi:hypothetical protein
MANIIQFPSPEQLDAMRQLLQAFLLLPFFDGIPGNALERAHAHVHQAHVLGTYEFVDVVDPARHIGWQVKSTKKSTPLTWKRAKIPGKEELIKESRISPAGRKKLGDAIIHFCNEHAKESIHTYKLQHLLYARLIDDGRGRYTYFERPLPISGILFDPDEFEWEWSKQKEYTTKEQLPAFHGKHIPTNRTFFAWHGLGENQLHFKGEYTWWPDQDYPYQVTFRAPVRQLTLPELLEMLSKVVQ